MCKSINDPLYGKGEEIEKNIFIFEGHLRHFFSENYSRELLDKNFKVSSLIKGGEDFYGHPSSFIEAIARKN